MKVSVIICTYSMERLQDTIDAINSILTQTYPHIETIISVDHNEELLAKLKELFPENVPFAFNNLVQGLSDTRNAGIKKATGDIIAFIDDDAIADKKWVEIMVSNYTNPDILAVGGKLVPLWEKDRPWWFPEELDWIVGCTYKGHPQEKRNVRNLIGCNMSFRREIFDKTGYFTNRLGRLGKNALGGEETELCLKIKAAMPKAKIIYEPQAVVYHKVPAFRGNFDYMLRRAYGEGLSKANIAKSLGKDDNLTTESGYLRFLLGKTFPGFIWNVLRLKNPAANCGRFVTVAGVTLATGLGYLRIKVRF